MQTWRELLSPGTVVKTVEGQWIHILSTGKDHVLAEHVDKRYRKSKPEKFKIDILLVHTAHKLSRPLEGN